MSEPSTQPKKLDQILERLTVSREEARNKIASRIENMNIFLGSLDKSKSLGNFIKCYYEYEKWNEYNEHFLRNLFVGENIYARYFGNRQHYHYREDQTDETNNISLLSLIDEKQKILESINNILEFCLESSNPIIEEEKKPLILKDNKKIFVVHGHDIGIKDSVAGFLEKHKLKLIFLDGQVSGGKTIIEQFEMHSASAHYAVILITPDDIGAVKGEETKLRPRASQNVILESGYFCGKLGRNRVCVLYIEDLELPSDMSGILCVRMDDAGAWKLKLAKEMKASGLDIDIFIEKLV